MHLFETNLSVCVEDIDLELQAYESVEWSSFLLNPRRLRGSDFLMRWSQGVWSEERIVQAVNETNEFFAIPYGPSGTAPTDDVRAFELYFERLEAAGWGTTKRPDLLIFQKTDELIVGNLIARLGGLPELPFTPENNEYIQALLSRTVIAVECENSLWKGQLMPDYGVGLKPQKRLSGKLGLKKSAVLPTIILKEEDRAPLQMWQDMHRISLHIWHVFYDMAFGISLARAQELINEGYIEPTAQTFQAPGGATTRKLLYKIYHHYGFPLGEAREEPQLVAKHIVDKNGHILPYVHFEGGAMSLKTEALNMLRQLANAKN